MKSKINILISVLSLLFIVFKVNAGFTFNCESVQSGDWDNPMTWTDCDGGYPNTANKAVLINPNHEVQLNRRNVTIHGLIMEIDSTLSIAVANEHYSITAEEADINTENGKIVSGVTLDLISNNGNVILGAVENTLVNRELKVVASMNVIVTDSDDGFNSFYFNAESTSPAGKIVVFEDINTLSFQRYNSLLELGRTVTLTGRSVEISGGLMLLNHSIELTVGNSNSFISGVINGTNSNFTKSGVGEVAIEGDFPIGITSFVNKGGLRINGIHQSNVILNSDSELKGNGQINSTLTMNDSSVLDVGSGFQVSNLEMNGNSKILKVVSGVDSNQVIINDGISFDGILQVSVNYPYSYAENITLIDYQGVGSINGTFDGLNEGDIIFDNFQISYQGGDGNDLTITSICGESIIVTNNLDSGPGSFRDAVANICSGGTIDFQDSYIITVDSTINFDTGSDFLTINGNGQTFQSSGNHSVFNIVDGAYVRLFGTTIQNSTTENGAITVNGYLVLDNAYFSNNLNTSMSGGGAISVYGGIAVYSSSFYQNNSSQGGAIYNNDGAVYVRNSTFYQNGNLLTHQGGAIYNNSQMELINITIADSGNDNLVHGNSIYDGSDNSFVRFVNSVIVNSKPSLSECFSNDGINFEINFEQNGNVLISDGSCDAPLSGDPLLGNWGDQGGETFAIPILTGSPLINTGFEIYCSGLPGNYYDQVGNPRTNGTSCDIGAIEFVDTSHPEILDIEINEELLSNCGTIKEHANEIKVIFTEPVLEAEEASNYELLHAGVDQSFLTSDDYVIQVVAAVSDNIRPQPTITLTTNQVVTDGLVRLIIDSEITDEFFLELYDGDGYQLQFRIDQGNLLKGGHFDDCVGYDPLSEWLVNSDHVVLLEADKDNSNVSFSLGTEVTENDSISMSQCTDIHNAVAFDFSLWLQDNSQSESLNSELNCLLYDQLECTGNQIEVVNSGPIDISNSTDWEMTSFLLGIDSNLLSSALCELTISGNQESANQIQIDAIRLIPKSDLIYLNGFESSMD